MVRPQLRKAGLLPTTITSSKEQAITKSPGRMIRVFCFRLLKDFNQTGFGLTESYRAAINQEHSFSFSEMQNAQTSFAILYEKTNSTYCFTRCGHAKLCTITTFLWNSCRYYFLGHERGCREQLTKPDGFYQWCHNNIEPYRLIRGR